MSSLRCGDRRRHADVAISRPVISTRSRRRRLTAVAVASELRSFRNDRAALLGDAPDLADAGLIEADGVLAQELRLLLALLDAREDEKDLVRVPETGGRLLGAREDGDFDASGVGLHLREHHEVVVLLSVLGRASHDAPDLPEVVP